MKFIKKAVKKAVAFLRGRHLRRLRRRLRNPEPTIIADTCIGGIIYHNLGLRFTSPTINMWITQEDYFVFLEELRGFLSVDPAEVTDSGYSYPVGELTYNGKTVRIHGNHYADFEEFKDKWNERRQRVDYDNLFIITLKTHFSKEEIERFEALPFENKLMITGKTEIERPFIVHHRLIDKKNYVPGMLMGYKSQLSVKRYMDDMDYVGFLNKNCKKRF